MKNWHVCYKRAAAQCCDWYDCAAQAGERSELQSKFDPNLWTKMAWAPRDFQMARDEDREESSRHNPRRRTCPFCDIVGVVTAHFMPQIRCKRRYLDWIRFGFALPLNLLASTTLGCVIRWWISFYNQFLDTLKCRIWLCRPLALSAPDRGPVVFLTFKVSYQRMQSARSP